PPEACPRQRPHTARLPERSKRPSGGAFAFEPLCVRACGFRDASLLLNSGPSPTGFARMRRPPPPAATRKNVKAAAVDGSQQARDAAPGGHGVCIMVFMLLSFSRLSSPSEQPSSWRHQCAAKIKQLEAAHHLVRPFCLCLHP